MIAEKEQVIDCAVRAFKKALGSILENMELQTVPGARVDEYIDFVPGSNREMTLLVEAIEDYLDSLAYEVNWIGGKPSSACPAFGGQLVNYSSRSTVTILATLVGTQFRLTLQLLLPGKK